MQLWPMEISRVCSSEKRKPLQILTGFFGRKSRRDGSSSRMANRDQGDSRETLGWLSHEEDDEDLLQVPEPREALHSPYHARTIEKDMEHLRLSRQDNPFLLEVLASRECLYESSESLYDEKHLMSKENVSRTFDHPLTLSEVHARLVRSPPPIMWTRSRNSETSFIHLLDRTQGGKPDSIFQFPPTHLQLPEGTSRSRSTQSDKKLYASSTSPGQFSDTQHTVRHGRFMESALEALTARFNLSPQPRRRPKDLGNLKTASSSLG